MHLVPAAAEPAAAAAVLHNNRDKAAICGLSLLFREKRYGTLIKKSTKGKRYVIRSAGPHHLAVSDEAYETFTKIRQCPLCVEKDEVCRPLL